MRVSHPLYDDEHAVARESRAHMAAGRTVFQLFQLSIMERLHSLRVLELLQLPMLARVLSLGCGVGGMERYWHDARPDLSFELVNNSYAQLELCQCPGKLVYADLTRPFESFEPGFDCTVIAYALGHLDIALALATAVANTRPGGVVVVLDVVDATPRFCEQLQYQPASSEQMREAGFELQKQPRWFLAPLFSASLPWIKRDCVPGMWTRHA